MIEVGQVYEWKRTFSIEEVLEFGRISGDQGAHHMIPDEQDRLMIHGLLTLSIGTKIGGDLNYIARTMDSEFLRPVFTGDTITCEVRIDNVIKCDGYKKIELTSIYKNQHGKQVLIGKSRGVVREN